MGDWVYYSCLMDLSTLAARVNYAEEIHHNKRLSQLIQRRLKKRRAAQIAHFLQTRSDRLFNSLVVATYEGEPNWHALTNVRTRPDNDELRDLPDHTASSVGFLTLRGDEKLFALDGQHRLAGIKKAVEDGIVHDRIDEVPVLFVAHRKTPEGLRRTRRLFTTLNKTAKPVSKVDIIALEEDNVTAFVVRWLLDDNPDMFGGDRIADAETDSMPSTNFKALTTVVNLYTVLDLWYTKARTPVMSKPRELRTRPDDEQLNAYCSIARQLFEGLRDGFPELGDFFAATDTEIVVRKHRGRHGGSALFRPVGLSTFVAIVARLTQEKDLGPAIAEAAKLPRGLDEAPYAGLIWDPRRRTVPRRGQVTLRDVLLHMLGRFEGDESDLLKRYRMATDDNAELPARVA